MKKNLTDTLEILLKAYGGYFDIDRNPQTAKPFCATAVFHSRSEKYFITKKAKLWAAECNEYVFFQTLQHLDIPTWQSLFEKAWEYGMKNVVPHSEHMSSSITLIVLTQTWEDALIKLVKKAKRRKNFMFSFHGWADFRCAILDIHDGQIITNSSGKELKKKS